MEEEKEEARGCGEEDEEVAAADSRRHRVEAGPAFPEDGGAHLAAEVATECIAGSFQDIQRMIT